MTQVQRIFFNEARGQDYIANLRIPQCASIEVQLEQKYYCLSATAAVIKYMEFLTGSGGFKFNDCILSFLPALLSGARVRVMNK